MNFHYDPYDPRKMDLNSYMSNLMDLVRELDEDEKKYLAEEFHPNDGARPYIKTSYKQLTPDNKIWGYIKRKRVPKHITIEHLK